MSRAHPGAEGQVAFVSVGPPLAPAEAAYLEHEIGKRGIETRLRAAGSPGPELVVEVRATDLEAAGAVRRAILGTAAEPEDDRRPAPDAGRRRRALLAAATGTVAVLYLGRRTVPAALRGLLGLAVGALVYLAVRRAGRSHA